MSHGMIHVIQSKIFIVSPLFPMILHFMLTLSTQLQEHVVRLRDEVDKERAERNFFQLERDKVNSFWEISQRQLEEAKATMRNKERELEDAEERHQVEIKVGEWGRLLSLADLIELHTHTVSAGVQTESEAPALRTPEQHHRAQERWSVRSQISLCMCVYVWYGVVGTVAMTLEEEQHRQHDADIRQEKRSLKVELKEMELAHQDATKALKMVCNYCSVESVLTEKIWFQEHDKAVTAMREEFEKMAAGMYIHRQYSGTHVLQLYACVVWCRA